MLMLMYMVVISATNLNEDWNLYCNNDSNNDSLFDDDDCVRKILNLDQQFEPTVGWIQNTPKPY